MALYWRVFPWDPRARSGELFSPSFVPPPTGRGRFDLPPDRSPVLYAAESPDHAVAEALQPWRNRPLRLTHLERGGHPLALVGVEVADGLAGELLDLCDPSVLVELELGPDRVASRDRRHTQPVAESGWEAGRPGLRWWSAFWGEWHTVVLFTERLRDGIRFSEPSRLELETPALRAAADALGMELPA